MAGRFELFALALLLFLGVCREVQASDGSQPLTASTILRHVMIERKYMPETQSCRSYGHGSPFKSESKLK